MAKVMKILGRTLGVLSEWVLIVIILLAFLIRTPQFQSYVARQATDFFSKEWNTTVRIGSVDITLFNRIYLEDILIKDLKKRDLISVKSLEVNIASFGTEHLNIDEITLKKGRVWVCRERKGGKMNFQFISDYFKSKDTTTSSSVFHLHLSKMALKNTSLRYDDFRASPVKHGLDFNHIHLAKVNLNLSNFIQEGSTLAFDLNHLATRDHSGFEVKHLRAKFAMNDQGMMLNSLLLLLNNSDIHASLVSMDYKSSEDLNDFNNKVKLNVHLEESSVQLADLAYLVPALKGMDEKVKLSGKVSNVINHLKINDLVLNIRKNTRIVADLELPDFSNLSHHKYREIIKKANIDFSEISSLRLPGGEKLILGDEVNRIEKLTFENLILDGRGEKLKLRPVTFKTPLGKLAIASPMLLDVFQKEISVRCLTPDSVALDIKGIALGRILENPELGNVEGKIKFNGFTLLEKGYILTGGKGKFSSLVAHGYDYKDVNLNSLSIKGQLATLDLTLNDRNAKLEIKGDLDISGKPQGEVIMEVDQVNLGNLGLTKANDSDLKGKFKISSKGANLDEFEAHLILSQFEYREGENNIEVPEANLNLNHSPEIDNVTLRSNIADLDFTGKIDPKTIEKNILYSLSRVVPSLVQSGKPVKGKINNEFTATVTTKDLDAVTQLFLPELEMAPNSVITCMMDSEHELLGLQFESNQVMYDSLFFEGINFQQRVNSSGVTANILINKVQLGDSLTFNELSFLTTGNAGKLTSSLGWDPNRLNDSRIEWNTHMLSANDLMIDFKQSRFSINGYKWFISKNSEVDIQNKHIQTSNFNMFSKNKEQKIEASGCLSDNPNDILGLNLTNIDLTDLSEMLNLGVELQGKVSGNVGLANPYKSLTLGSDIMVSGFYINKEEVGNIEIKADYNSQLSKVDLKGNLAYRGTRTLDFTGDYFLDRSSDNLALNLNFNNTDISFANAFMDPNVLDKIQGKLNGNVSVNGTPDHPRLKGILNLKEAGADFTLLGCRYTMNGKINIEEDGFYINKLPIRDSDGNVASLEGTVYHSNFSKFNYNIDLDFEEDYHHIYNKQPGGKIEKFMLLNTKYKEGDVYYGKAFGRGTANISGYGSIMDVTVNVQTQKGTKLVFPMYGTSELEEESIIHFVSHEDEAALIEDKINFTGVNLDLRFDITPDAEVRLVFNEQTQDEIKAKTQGRLNLSLDAYNQMNLDGGLNIMSGSVYNFTMGPARKPFDILSGSINWSGNVYNAIIDIVTSYTVKNANMQELTSEQTNKELAKQDAQCLLNLTGTLMKPNIGFEIAAPKAPEAGKVLLNRINEDKDELNRQFFSLMLFSKFQPIKGTNSASESAAFDLFESQINSALSQMSKSYEVKMDLSESNVSTSVQKSFLKDRLIISGSFGVQSDEGATSATGGLVGDVSLEYLVNEKGTFRVNAFNRSNSNTVKENAGPFTQGAGLSYHEEFNSGKDFILMQSFLDVFRSKENKVVKFKRKKRQTKVPPVGTHPDPKNTSEKKEENE